MVGGLRQCSGDVSNSLGSQIGQRSEASFIAVRNLIYIARIILAGDVFKPAMKAFGPAPLHLGWLAKNVVDAPVALAQFRAHQKAITKLKAGQVVLDEANIFIVEFTGNHGEESSKPFGVEPVALLQSDPPQSLQKLHKQLENLDRPVQGPLGIPRRHPSPYLSLALHRLDGEAVHVPNGFRMVQAIGEDVLPVLDRIRLNDAPQHGGSGHAEQELVSSGHRLE